jgi:CubicO group peptidase (beta-lactamase class C family)
MAHARQLVPPGSHLTYSNAAYSVAGRLVEVLEGEPFGACLTRRILGPLAMERSCTRADGAIFHRVAMRHLSLPDRDPIPLPGGGWQRGWEIGPADEPAAGLISSAHDLMQWLRFWLGREGSAEPLGLSAADRAVMLGEQARFNERWGQAIGWGIRYDDGARVYNHGGLTAGYCSFTLFVPELDLAAVILTNATSGGALHSELSRWIVSQASGVPWQDPAPLEPPPDLAAYAGRYWSAFGMIEVRALDDGCSLELSGEPHSTEDGSWQPPRESPMRFELYHPHHGVVREPENLAGALIDFDPEGSPQPAWLRSGGRIALRESDVG